MGDANEGKRSIPGMEKLSLETNRFPRDLLQRFMASNNQSQFTSMCKDEEEREEIELNLALSLGGRFGVDKSENKKLMRSSSIAGSIPIVRDDFDAATVLPVSVPALMRTSSLPAEMAEEWRKRKELQTLRRMEAKRRSMWGPPNWFGLAAAGGGDVGQGFVQRSGSVESQGGSPSGLSESDGKPVQVFSWILDFGFLAEVK
ncbi:ABI five binding protein 2 [Actinidia rufa]|uniref:Ninja-family protein n=1 Tax=Actinidia rufa TaxID=165716 RepID=A0A7J0EQH4_9ERIC|nr:ABI five binding protein 2 [Actinidia rufa]